MATYQVTAPDGSQYDLSGDPNKVQDTVHSILSPQADAPLIDTDKTISNIVPDLKQLAANTVNMTLLGIKLGSGNPTAALPQLMQAGMEVFKNPKATAQAIARPVLHPIDYFQEHPVQQTLNVLGGAGLAAEGVGSLLNAVPLTENLVPSIARVMDNQTLKSFGGTMGQLKQMETTAGRPALEAAAKVARDSGLTDVFTTAIGREQILKSLLDLSGKVIGKLRAQAGAAPPDTLTNIVANPAIDKYLGEGSAGKELGGVDRALNDIKEIAGPNPTHEDLANAATYINKNAAGTKIYQPVNAETEVANILSRENDAGIAQT